MMKVPLYWAEELKFSESVSHWTKVKNCEPTLEALKADLKELFGESYQTYRLRQVSEDLYELKNDSLYIRRFKLFYRKVETEMEPDPATDDLDFENMFK